MWIINSYFSSSSSMQSDYGTGMVCDGALVGVFSKGSACGIRNIQHDSRFLKVEFFYEWIRECTNSTVEISNTISHNVEPNTTLPVPKYRYESL